jgi:hypothetical protein
VNNFTRPLERFFQSGAIGRVAAAAFLRSADPSAHALQKGARVLRLRRLEHKAAGFRLEWRSWFEAKICAMANERLRNDVDRLRDLYEQSGTRLPAVDTLAAQVIQSLECDEFFRAEMEELQRLPISASALRRRLRTLDRAIAGHIAVLAQETSPVSGIFWIAQEA